MTTTHNTTSNPTAQKLVDRLIAAEMSGEYEPWAVRVLRDARMALQIIPTEPDIAHIYSVEGV